MGTFAEVYDRANLERAWGWIRSNPDATYKQYFRDLYTTYALADSQALDSLSDRLRRGIYEPKHACKIFFPKPSGILRPFSLLAVEDQIVYQALINVVADRLIRKVRKLYFKVTFGHLYAGRSSTWFYQKWSDGYAGFNRAARAAHSAGFRYGATFDLTACYDTVDHGVLRYFLRRLGCDNDFCAKLTSFLSTWTATNARIYHNHGIPQGPLSSGLLSEVILQHFDRNRGSEQTVRYLRYVDDIKLFAKNPAALRKMIVRLDTLSKDVGLFPQSSKIDIHEIRNIEEELKTISQPTEAAIRGATVNQHQLRKRVVQLTPRYKVVDVTRFKVLLAHAEPSHILNSRLWRVYEKQPHLYPNILRYFQKYEKLPRTAASRLVAELEAKPLYAAVAAALLDTATGRLSPHLSVTVDAFVRSAWRPNSAPADLLAVLGRWAINRNLFNYNQLSYAIRKTEWWTQAQLVSALNLQSLGIPTSTALLNDRLRDSSDDVGITAAWKLASESLAVQPPLQTLNHAAVRVLKELSLIRRGPHAPCGIHLSFGRLLKCPIPKINWRNVFSGSYARAERQALLCRALAETNITAWVNAMDVFIDLLLVTLYRKDPTLGTYALGSIGSVLGSTRLRTKYPAIQALASSVHKKRLESALSHAAVRTTGRPTGLIKYSYLRPARRLLLKALLEVGTLWAPAPFVTVPPAPLVPVP